MLISHCWQFLHCRPQNTSNEKKCIYLTLIYSFHQCSGSGSVGSGMNWSTGSGSGSAILDFGYQILSILSCYQRFNPPIKGHGNQADFLGFLHKLVRHTVGPLHYNSSRSDFGFEFAGIFGSKKHVFRNFEPFLANWALKFQKMLI